MALLLCALLLIFAYSSITIADLVQRQTTPEVKALAQRRSRTVPKYSNLHHLTVDYPPSGEYRFLPPIAATANTDAGVGEEDDGLELLDIVLVASVDGKFHALNRTSGQTVWSMPSFSTVTPSPSGSLSPLVRTTHPDPSPIQDGTTQPHEVYIIEPQSGEIYVLPSSNPSAPLQHFPYTMPQLVDMSPFSFTGDTEKRVFIGKKETSLLVLELETGKVRTISAECPWDPDPWEDFNSKDTGAEVDLDELELEIGTEDNEPRKQAKPPKPTEVLIGRTDYHISIQTKPVAKGSSPSRQSPTQNLTFSTYGPNNQDHALQATYRRTKDDQYIQSLPGGEILSFRVRGKNNSGTERPQKQSELLWASSFGQPVVAVFDILRRPSLTHHDTFALLQPRPRLSDMLPSVNIPLTSDGDDHPEYPGIPRALINAFPNIESAYVGLVPETGSLYAMSPERFPLVAFGWSSGHARYGQGKYIDGPRKPDGAFDGLPDAGRVLEEDREADGDEPIEVDAITRARKIRERQQQMMAEKEKCSLGAVELLTFLKRQSSLSDIDDNSIWDRSCLTGVRRLAAGSADRVQRLLDAGKPNNSKKEIGGGEEPSVLDVPDKSTELANMTVRGKDSWWMWRSQSTTGLPEQSPVHGINGGTSSMGISVLLALALGIIGLIGLFVRRRGSGKEKALMVVKREGQVNGDLLNGEAHKATLVTENATEVEITEPPPSVLEIPPITHAVNMATEAPLTPNSKSPTSTTKPQRSNSASHPMTHQKSKSSQSENQNSDQLDDVDDSDKEGEFVEGDGENEVVATPGKRKGRRGKRGKRKKAGVVHAGSAEEERQESVADKENGEKVANKEDAEPLAVSGVRRESSSTKAVSNGPSLVVSDTVLGFGSHGTVVFKGSLQGRAVAVKRLLIDFVTLASREVSILQESDDHPNVIRYYYQEASGGFLYIALELCPASLADIIETPDRDDWRDIAISFDPKRALRQITSGLKHLHGLKLVHRDIKPQNILISAVKGPTGSVTNARGAGWRMLISDFGLCKKLDVDQTSFLPTAHGAMAAGTVGWRAPEILRGEVKLDDVGNDDHSMSSRGSVATVNGASGGSTNGSNNGVKPTRLTKSVDIFSLGCLYYYTLTNGGHPFGDRFEREVNILKNAKSLEGLERFGEEGAEAVHLIEKMLDPEARLRPDTTTCLLHPFFWDPGRRLNFLQEASDRFEIMCRDPKDTTLLTLERNALSIVGHDWHSRLDKIFTENLGKFRKYDGKSVQDLLRALRNKKHHYQDLPDNVKRHLGPMPEGFLAYFTRRYPKLFLHVHSVIEETGLHKESTFRSYFELAEP